MSRKNRKKRKGKASPHELRRRADRKWFQKHLEFFPTICADCGKVAPLQFHHERYDIPRVGRFLCEECHMKEHGTKPNWAKRMKKERRRNEYWMHSRKYKEMERRLQEEQDMEERKKNN